MSLSRYPEYSNLHQPSLEDEVLQKWTKENTFLKSIEERSDAPSFVFYEGPPSANGMPGIHHVISRTIKDLFCRYKTQKGFLVRRKAGWDTHGLPIELGVEKALGITKVDIGTKISVAEYNKKCLEQVFTFKDSWELLTRKMGYWVDMEHPYITCDPSYIESVWWCLKELYHKKLLYKSVSIQPYSPAAGTGLSSHELNQPGTHKNVKDVSVIAMFALSSQEKQNLALQTFEYIQKLMPFTIGTHKAGPYFLAWTTTPWTLPSNLGLVVGAKIDYVLIHTLNPYTLEEQYVILAQNLLTHYFKPEYENLPFERLTPEDKHLPWRQLTSFKGADLENLRYEQLMPGALPSDTHADPFRVVLGDFVRTEDGTGIVHAAPAFGADDYKVGQKYRLGMLVLVDKEGKFTDEVPTYAARYVKNYQKDPHYVDVNLDICLQLKKEGRAFKVEKYEHSYPHCWRTDMPILYYPLESWFVKTTAVKERMIALNQTIQWKPASTGSGRFGNWLENMVDWNLGRSRFWGTPLPIWRSADGKEEKCIGSLAELTAEIKKASLLNTPSINAISTWTDIHKPLVDDIILVSSQGEPMYREPDLIDVWFDSGAMPYAQWHYPFENKEVFERSFPADFVCEGVDQTRGWFFTLHTLAVMLFDKPAFKHVVSNGLVLDKDGNKMSKRLGNTIDPFETLRTYGADATRWYLITNSLPWDNLKFDIEGIKEVQRKFFGTLYNTYHFFAMYANVDNFTFQEASIPLRERAEIDRWILSVLHHLVQDVDTLLEAYEATEAYRKIEYFLDEQLSNWYVRLCRRRFWKGEYEVDKIAAYQTLYECLETLSMLIAPVAPFFAEWLFGNLNTITAKHKTSSVHFTLFPVATPLCFQPSLEAQMTMARDVVSLALSLRKNLNIKVRQPLQKILIPVLDAPMQQLIAASESLILQEVNVKEMVYVTNTRGIVRKRAKANFTSLGKRLGSQMKQVAQRIASLTQDEIETFEATGSFCLQMENEEVKLTRIDIELFSENLPGFTAMSKGSLTVALDLTITQALTDEGHAREFINRVQKIRKEQKLALTQKIMVRLLQGSPIQDSLQRFESYICKELLATELLVCDVLDSYVEIEVNDGVLRVCITKA